MLYDYIIVGAGPAGLSLAGYIKNHDKNSKVLVLEKTRRPGGCHSNSISKVSDYNIHSPVVYTSAYYNFFKAIEMADIGSFDDLFIEYKSGIIQEFLSEITTLEAIKLTVLFCINSVYPLVNIPVNRVFPRKFFDKICKLTDGAGSDRYSLDQFIQIFNENIFHKLYQQRTCKLFDKWVKSLENLGTEFILNTTVNSFGDGFVKDTCGNEYVAKKVIFCIPPVKSSVLGRQTIANTDYSKYFCVTFFWKDKQIIFPKSVKTDTEIIYVVSSDYNDDLSGTVISVSVLQWSDVFENSSTETKVSEVFKVLQQKTGTTQYDHFNVSDDSHTGYCKTVNSQKLPWKISDKTFQVSTGNWSSDYSFTSCESAASNSLYFAKNVLNLKNLPDYRYNLLKLTRVLAFIIMVIFLNKIY
jgi:NAD(P)-binding Rossmann-like domain